MPKAENADSASPFQSPSMLHSELKTDVLTKTLNAASMQRTVEDCAAEEAFDSAKVRETKRRNFEAEGSRLNNRGTESEERRRERKADSLAKETKGTEMAETNRKYEKLCEEHSELKETVSAERRESRKETMRLQ
jgi:hypothetical protein